MKRLILLIALLMLISFAACSPAIPAPLVEPKALIITEDEQAEEGIITAISNEIDVKIQMVSSSNDGFNSLAVMENGDLYMWGSNLYGQIGNGQKGDPRIDSEYSMCEPYPIKVLEDVIFADYGRGYSIAITESKELFVWGKNDYGQVGDKTLVNKTIPIKIMEDVEFAVAEANNTIAITKNGDMYIWGRDSSGKIGNGKINDDRDYVWEPFKVLTNVRFASCGFQQVIAITEKDELYIWGLADFEYMDGLTDRDFYDLGYYDSALFLQPTKVMENVKTASVIAGSFGSNISAITHSGELYLWGSNEFGQIGNGTFGDGDIKSYDQIEPYPVMVMENVVQYSSDGLQSLAVTEAGELFSWGLNKQFDIDTHLVKTTNREEIIETDLSEYIDPIPVEVMNGVDSVIVSEQTIIALNNEGQLFAWGDNMMGKVGNGQDVFTGHQQEPYEVLDNVDQFTFNGFSVLAKTKEGTLYGWGRNGAGQLGNGNSGSIEFEVSPIKINFDSGAHENLDNDETLLALAPDLYGLEKSIQKTNGTEKVIYTVSEENQFGLEKGDYVGEFKKEVYFEGREFGGVILIPQIVKQMMSVETEGYTYNYLPIPVDVSQLPVSEKVNLSFVSNAGLLVDPDARSGEILKIEFAGSLPILGIVNTISNYWPMGTGEYALRISPEFRMMPEWWDEARSGTRVKPEYFFMTFDIIFESMPSALRSVIGDDSSLSTGEYVIEDIEFGAKLFEAESPVLITENIGYSLTMDHLLRVGQSIVFVKEEEVN